MNIKILALILLAFCAQPAWSQTPVASAATADSPALTTRLALRLKLTHAMRDALVDDASGDRLDAVLCLVQAAWAAEQPGHGLPAAVDPLEGWITSAPMP